MDDSHYFAFTAEDEALHAPGPEAQWNESFLFHLVETKGERALMLRIGRRLNEGHSEVTVTQLFPDGSIAVNFARDPTPSPDAVRAGGLAFTMIEPLKAWRATFAGEVSCLRDGTQMKDPKALGLAPKSPCAIDLTFRDLIPVFGAAPGGSYVSAETINQRHYEGITEAKGWITINGKRTDIAGFGFRDHSWGVRNWQTIDYWRWCYGNIDRNNIFSACILQAGGVPQVNGVLLRDGKLEVVTQMSVRCQYGPGPDHYLESAELTVPSRNGEFRAQMKSICKMPLRHRKDGKTLRIVENMAAFESGSGSGYGWIEAADLIVDGKPFGNAVT